MQNGPLGPRDRRRDNPPSAGETYRAVIAVVTALGGYLPNARGVGGGGGRVVKAKRDSETLPGHRARDGSLRAQTKNGRRPSDSVPITVCVCGGGDFPLSHPERQLPVVFFTFTSSRPNVYGYRIGRFFAIFRFPRS